MSNYSPYQKTMLATWERHGAAEFELKDPKAAIATMCDDPYIMNVAYGQLIAGRDAVYNFYAKDFLPKIPPDFAMIPLRRVVGADSLADEFVVRFTHSIDMPWQVPDLPATGRKAEIVMTVFVGFEGDRIKYEHLLWDHGSLLSQLGALDYPSARGAWSSPAQMMRLCPAPRG